jgi:sialic acid synthase SpsE
MDELSSQINAVASTYNTDTIFILGKGSSIDLVPPEVYAGSLVIGINDAERIYPADISIFHAEWVKKALAESGARARLYLTSTDYKPSGAQVVRAPYSPLTQENSDLMIQRLLSDTFVIEDLLFLSALKVARKVAQLRGRHQTVYMVGFDFRSDVGYAKALDKRYEIADQDEKIFRIQIQENYFLNSLYMLRDTNIDVCHVGSRSFSRITPDELALQFLPQQATDAEGAHRWNVSLVAELTTNHFGDRSRLERLVRASKAAGADYVKLQKRDVKSFYSKEQLASPYKSPFGETFADYRYQLELSGDDFTFLDQLCKSIGIKWFASILDEPSYRFMMDFDPAMIKLPSTISEHRDYLALVASTFERSIVLSTGMTDQAYEAWVLDTFKKCSQLYLLQCNSAYPTPIHDCNVGVVRRYHGLSTQNPKIIPGYSSHDFGWLGSALAVAAGARMVEKHVKLGNTEWAHFDAVAIDLATDDFKEYVKKVREAEIIVGSEVKQINRSEHHKYKK